MTRIPPRSTRTDTLFPYATLFRSGVCAQALRTAGGADRAPARLAPGREARAGRRRADVRESVRPRPVRLPQLGRARCEGSRTLFLPAQAAVDGGGGAVAERAGPRRGAARPAARTDEGDGAGRAAAGGVRDGRVPVCAARAPRHIG